MCLREQNLRLLYPDRLTDGVYIYMSMNDIHTHAYRESFDLLS